MSAGGRAIFSCRPCCWLAAAGLLLRLLLLLRFCYCAAAVALSSAVVVVAVTVTAAVTAVAAVRCWYLGVVSLPAARCRCPLFRLPQVGRFAGRHAGAWCGQACQHTSRRIGVLPIVQRMCACARASASVRPCVRACMHACIRLRMRRCISACARAGVRACMRACDKHLSGAYVASCRTQYYLFRVGARVRAECRRMASMGNGRVESS